MLRSLDSWTFGRTDDDRGVRVHALMLPRLSCTVLIRSGSCIRLTDRPPAAANEAKKEPFFTPLYCPSFFAVEWMQRWLAGSKRCFHARSHPGHCAAQAKNAKHSETHMSQPELLRQDPVAGAKAEPIPAAPFADEKRLGIFTDQCLVGLTRRREQGSVAIASTSELCHPCHACLFRDRLLARDGCSDEALRELGLLAWNRHA
ncbi:hypothetical protein B0T22DRAFT_254813 [Podospora appendiculata]|uniref:Uncharacterized protein n=1 Tax=Podospora appendiculata TaxID=314037 RepID=A0AAE1C8Y4_9PEZI|nr:hypothetical protein B0T22DRAFT_254813 [Podospora appendiculata]